MAQYTPTLYPLIVIPPLLDQALGMPELAVIFRSYDNLPSFTLILDWKCPACGESKPSEPDEVYSEENDHSDNHRRASTGPFLELRDMDQPKYLIWPEKVTSTEHKNLFSQDLPLLASKCEYAAQWQFGSGKRAYLKVVPGPIMDLVQDIRKYEVPLFFIRPSISVWNRIDAKIIFFKRENLPSVCFLFNLPSDECFEMKDLQDGSGSFVQGLRDDADSLPEPTEVLQKSPGGPDIQTNALLALNPALDKSTQLFIAGIPDGTLRPLAVHAFRVLRYHQVDHVYSSLLHSYIVNENLWGADVWEIPKFRDSKPLWTAEWWYPEQILDFLKNHEQVERMHLKPLNPKGLFKLKLHHYNTYLYHDNLDMSSSSTEFRLIEVKTSREHEPTHWRFLHVELEGDSCPPFSYIGDYASDLCTTTPCKIVLLNNRKTAIPDSLLENIQTLAKETEGFDEGASKFYFFLKHLCIDATSREEFEYHQLLDPHLRDRAKSLVFSVVGNCFSLLAINSQRSLYQPLEQDSNQIRLILLKGSQILDSALSAEMISMDIENAPKFVAMSHDWGTTGPPGSISIEGNEFMISNELETALKQLRFVSESTYVWVDFLSIDHENLDERASQTSLLPYIYSSADYVFVWLGEIKSDFVRIINALSRIDIPPLCTELPQQHVEVIRILLEIDGVIEGLKSFLKTTWWQKIWMIQPFVLAKSLEFYTGKAMVEWDVLGKAIKVLHTYVFLSPLTSQIHRSPVYQLLSPLISKVYEVSLLREGRMNVDHLTPAIARSKDYFLFCLFTLYSRDYTDARDIVYTACMLAQENAPQLRLNYKATVREVYHDTAKAIISYYGELKLLSHIFFSRRRHESRKTGSDVPTGPSYYWPSWVPDWRLRPWGLGATSFDLRDTKLSPQLMFNACGGVKGQFKFSGDSKILFVESLQVGRIQKVFQTKEGYSAHIRNDQVSQSPDLEGEWAMLSLKPPGDKHEYIAGGSWAAAWVKTCDIMDREAYYGVSKRRLIQLPLDNFESTLRTMNFHGAICPSLTTHSTATWQYGTPEPPSWDGINTILKPRRIKNAEGIVIEEERFQLFTLDSGYVGFGGYAVREGDFVFILKGGSYPYVLRQRRDGFYHFVSDSYVHGIMDGEFVQIQVCNNLGADANWQELGIV